MSAKMSYHQQLVKKMSNMALSDGRKTRHESKLQYRKDHMSPQAIEQLSRAVEQIRLPDTFSPTHPDPLRRERLPATCDRDMKAELGVEYNATKDGLDNDTIKAAPSGTKAAVRSDPDGRSKIPLYCDNSKPALAPASDPKECFECGQEYFEGNNAPNACVFHWANLSQAYSSPGLTGGTRSGVERGLTGAPCR
ncbi:hypothetical protein PG997_003059 [Apiospora hydei]|uniref:Uncharacterized protein n=1 Tax=Apiospora hydei TaxID=1337664 RepID=A0ABR1WY91_9PEZI